MRKPIFWLVAISLVLTACGMQIAGPVAIAPAPEFGVPVMAEQPELLAAQPQNGAQIVHEQKCASTLQQFKRKVGGESVDIGKMDDEAWGLLETLVRECGYTYNIIGGVITLYKQNDQATASPTTSAPPPQGNGWTQEQDSCHKRYKWLRLILTATTEGAIYAVKAQILMDWTPPSGEGLGTLREVIRFLQQNCKDKYSVDDSSSGYTIRPNPPVAQPPAGN